MPDSSSTTVGGTTMPVPTVRSRPLNLLRVRTTDGFLVHMCADVKNANKLENYLNEQLKIYVDP
jgi:hypothetical protein